MLTISPEALSYIQTQGKSVYLDIPPEIGCCIHLNECPSVRFGVPHNLAAYDKTNLQGVTVYVPHQLPDIPLTIVLTSFLGFKKLVIEGWRLA